MAGAIVRGLAICAALYASADAAERTAAEVWLTISPRALAALIVSEGGEAEVQVGAEDTILGGVVDGTPYEVYFYDCDGGAFAGPATPDSACLSFEYRAYFEGYPDDGEIVNAYNDAYQYGGLWRDGSGDLALQLNVIVEGGVTDANLGASFAWWRAVLASFHDFMEER